MIPGLRKLPGGGDGNPLHYSCLENPHGQRSLADYDLWGHKEKGTRVTKHSTAQHSVAESGLHPREGDTDKRAQKRSQDLWVTTSDLLKRLPTSGASVAPNVKSGLS